MIIKTVILSFLFIFLVSLSGCATARKEMDLEAQRLKNQITVLESQLQIKEDEISSLKESLARKEQEKETLQLKRVDKKQIAEEVKYRPNTKQIQTALKNAGFGVGTIDGKMGKKTIEAIKSFQKTHNLSVDGKVGRATRNLLKEYLYKKVK